MTMLLAALAFISSSSGSLAVRAPRIERVDRALVALRVVRDLDRDGVQDLCVRLASDGRAQIALISAAQGTAVWISDGPDGVVDRGREPMAGAIAPLGDHDGDGLGEIAALWRDTESSSELRGVVLAIHAGADGRVLRAVDVAGPALDARATAVSATGDLDGDLLPDLIVLAPAREPMAGRVRAISSANGAELWSVPTTARGDETGTSNAVLRDLDGDATVDLALVVDGGVDVLSGRDGRRLKHVESSAIDVVVLADSTDERGSGPIDPDATTTAQTDATHVASARVDALRSAVRALTAALAVLDTDARDDHVSTDATSTDERRTRTSEPLRWIPNGSIAVIGDLDADAILDLYVPQRASIGPASSAAIVSVGRANLVERRPLPVWSIELGSSAFRAAGDMDGDKRIDILCSDPGWNAPGSVDAGAVRVLSGMDGREVRAWRGGPTITRLGAHAAAAGDVDRDGVNDVWMSAVDIASTPHTVIALASGRTGEFLRWIDLGRMTSASRP